MNRQKNEFDEDKDPKNYYLDLDLIIKIKWIIVNNLRITIRV